MRLLSHLIVILGFLGSATAASAMIIESKTIKSKASLVKNRKLKTFDFLDLKHKQIQFTQRDLKSCESVLYRRNETLQFSCTIRIPSKSKISKLSRRMSANEVLLRLGEKDKVVRMNVSRDARLVTFSTHFQGMGIDYDMTEFNADFHAIMSQAALNLFQKAMKTRLVMQVLEN